MPAQPRPATGAGEFVIKYFGEPHHVRAKLFRRASTGALVEIGTERVSYSIAQDTLAAEDDSIPFSDELGWVGDPEELGAIGKKIKRFAMKVAKSKLGQIAAKAGKLATSFVPGGSAALTGLKTAKAGVKFAKSLKQKRRPAPSLDYPENEEEVGAAAKRPTPRKPAPKAAPKPKPKPIAKAKPKPIAKAKPKLAAKPKPKPPKRVPPVKMPQAKTLKKPVKMPVPRNPKTKNTIAAKPSKPATSAAAKRAKVANQGGPSATLARAAANTNSPAKQAQAAKLAALVEQIEDDAPELAATLATLPETDPDDRDEVEDRAVAAAQKLAATPPAQRAAMAAKLEQRIDGYKVEAPNGDVVWVPIEEVETGDSDPGGGEEEEA